MVADVKLYETPQVARWYFGGIASIISGTCMHPLDLLKVQLQTQGDKTFFQIVKQIFKEHGCLGLYGGLTSSWMGQFVYASIRFTLFDWLKRQITDPNFFQRVCLSGFSGLVAGMAGNPLDVVKVNMQNDSKLPPEERKNYKNGFDGLIRIIREDGVMKLFSGITFGTARAIVMTIGQMAIYDQMKHIFLSTGINLLKDAILNHFISSFIAGIVAITITQPVDVMKTRLMTSAPGTYTGLWNCFIITAKEGILAFYKGVVLAAIRTMSMTVITFVTYEQLRQNFGYLPEETESTINTITTATVSVNATSA